MGVSQLVESRQRPDGETVRDILVPSVYAHGLGDIVWGQPCLAHAIRRAVADTPEDHARHLEQDECTRLRTLPGRGIQTPSLRLSPYSRVVVLGNATVRELGHHERRVREAHAAGRPEDPGAL